MINSIVENYLIQFQKILALLIKRSSETAFSPLISFYKSQLETEINFIIKKAHDTEENHENLLIMAESIDAFLSKTLDVEINRLKLKNKSLYTEYIKYRSKKQRKTTSLPNYSGKANFGITQTLNLPYLSSRNFLIKNNGSVALSFCLCENFKNLEGTQITLHPNETIMRSSGFMNANAKANKFYAINKEQIAGNYKIWVL